jgi:hypothetical protein
MMSTMILPRFLSIINGAGHELAENVPSQRDKRGQHALKTMKEARI